MNIQHGLDQISAMLRDIVPIIRDYHLNLVKSGFTEVQAFTLTRDYQLYLFGGKNNEK